MAKFSKGEVVEHCSGSIRGIVENVIEIDGLTTGYYVAWDSGDYQHHFEKELKHVDASSRPQIYRSGGNV